ncbi:MAG: bifunctional riboflavin kinase/FAD synthetase [Elusimicrobiota bacterium]|nr:bifunctional riboflavin kinase/FAD synthetase [Elusimicrobiota bacterium]
MEKSVVTIGTFDGVHRGHQVLINKTLSIAQKHKLKSVLITLEKPFKKSIGLITTIDEKLEILKTHSFDEIAVLKVTSDIFSFSCGKFFDEFLVKIFNVSHVVCGNNFAFGKGRKGNVCWLKKISKKNNIEISVVKPLMYCKKQISSSNVRDLLSSGQISIAAKTLGRNYSFEGIPFREKGLGKKIGFPTINLKTDKDKIIPCGVFITLISQGEKIYPSITNIGSRITFNRGTKIIPETHILNFDKTWKKSKTKITLLKKIRDEKKFKDIKSLKQQIVKDNFLATKFFNMTKQNHS